MGTCTVSRELMCNRINDVGTCTVSRELMCDRINDVGTCTVSRELMCNQSLIWLLARFLVRLCVINQ